MQPEKSQRRSSILKPPKARNPLTDLDSRRNDDEITTIDRNKRVSFSRTQDIALFRMNEHGTTIWDNFFKEPNKINISECSDSSHPQAEKVEDLSDTDKNLHMLKTDSEISQNDLRFEEFRKEVLDDCTNDENKIFDLHNTTLVPNNSNLSNNMDDDSDHCTIDPIFNNANKPQQRLSDILVELGCPSETDHTEALINYKISPTNDYSGRWDNNVIHGDEDNKICSSALEYVKSSVFEDDNDPINMSITPTIPMPILINPSSSKTNKLTFVLPCVYSEIKKNWLEEKENIQTLTNVNDTLETENDFKSQKKCSNKNSEIHKNTDTLLNNREPKQLIFTESSTKINNGNVSSSMKHLMTSPNPHSHSNKKRKIMELKNTSTDILFPQMCDTHFVPQKTYNDNFQGVLSENKYISTPFIDENEDSDTTIDRIINDIDFHARDLKKRFQTTVDFADCLKEDNQNFEMSMTSMIPQTFDDRRKTLIFDHDNIESELSMTCCPQKLNNTDFPIDIINENNDIMVADKEMSLTTVVPETHNIERRKTMVFDNDDIEAELSMTCVGPQELNKVNFSANIIEKNATLSNHLCENKDEHKNEKLKKTEDIPNLSTDYSNEAVTNKEISITTVVPETHNIERRKILVFDHSDVKSELSMTCVEPQKLNNVNFSLRTINEKKNTTLNGHSCENKNELENINISKMSDVSSCNEKLSNKEISITTILPQSHNIEKRKTIVFDHGNIGSNLWMTSVDPQTLKNMNFAVDTINENKNTILNDSCANRGEHEKIHINNVSSCNETVTNKEMSITTVVPETHNIEGRKTMVFYHNNIESELTTTCVGSHKLNNMNFSFDTIDEHKNTTLKSRSCENKDEYENTNINKISNVNSSNVLEFNEKLLKTVNMLNLSTDHCNEIIINREMPITTVVPETCKIENGKTTVFNHGDFESKLSITCNYPQKLGNMDFPIGIINENKNVVLNVLSCDNKDEYEIININKKANFNSSDILESNEKLKKNVDLPKDHCSEMATNKDMSITAVVSETHNIERRKTMVFNHGDIESELSMTCVGPQELNKINFSANIIDKNATLSNHLCENKNEHKNEKLKKTENIPNLSTDYSNEAVINKEMSITTVVPETQNLIDKNFSVDTINKNENSTLTVHSNICENKDEHDNEKLQKTFNMFNLSTNPCNEAVTKEMSITATVQETHNIERRKTAVFNQDDIESELSMTCVGLQELNEVNFSADIINKNATLTNHLCENKDEHKNEKFKKTEDIPNLSTDYSNEAVTNKEMSITTVVPETQNLIDKNFSVETINENKNATLTVHSNICENKDEHDNEKLQKTFNMFNLSTNRCNKAVNKEMSITAIVQETHNIERRKTAVFDHGDVESELSMTCVDPQKSSTNFDINITDENKSLHTFENKKEQTDKSIDIDCNIKILNAASSHAFNSNEKSQKNVDLANLSKQDSNEKISKEYSEVSMSSVVEMSMTSIIPHKFCDLKTNTLNENDITNRVVDTNINKTMDTSSSSTYDFIEKLQGTSNTKCSPLKKMENIACKAPTFFDLDRLCNNTVTNQCNIDQENYDILMRNKNHDLTGYKSFLQQFDKNKSQTIISEELKDFLPTMVDCSAANLDAKNELSSEDIDIPMDCDITFNETHKSANKSIDIIKNNIIDKSLSQYKNYPMDISRVITPNKNNFCIESLENNSPKINKKNVSLVSIHDSKLETNECLENINNSASRTHLIESNVSSRIVEEANSSLHCIQRNLLKRDCNSSYCAKKTEDENDKSDIDFVHSLEKNQELCDSNQLHFRKSITKEITFNKSEEENIPMDISYTSLEGEPCSPQKQGIENSKMNLITENNFKVDKVPISSDETFIKDQTVDKNNVSNKEVHLPNLSITSQHEKYNLATSVCSWIKDIIQTPLKPNCSTEGMISNSLNCQFLENESDISFVNSSVNENSFQSNRINRKCIQNVLKVNEELENSSTNVGEVFKTQCIEKFIEDLMTNFSNDECIFDGFFPKKLKFLLMNQTIALNIKFRQTESDYINIKSIIESVSIDIINDMSKSTNNSYTHCMYIILQNQLKTSDFMSLCSDCECIPNIITYSINTYQKAERWARNMKFLYFLHGLQIVNEKFQFRIPSGYLRCIWQVEIGLQNLPYASKEDISIKVVSGCSEIVENDLLLIVDSVEKDWNYMSNVITELFKYIKKQYNKNAQ